MKEGWEQDILKPMHEVLKRTVAEVIDSGHLEKRLTDGSRLRVKLGIDPTSPNIHIGRAVMLWKLRAFQDLGHTAILIVGDFTGLIGDTSDKESERPMLSEEQVQKNMKSYFEQAFKILDPKKTETYYNSEWLKSLGFIEIGKMADLFGLHEFEARENIARRLRAGKRVSLRELLYPLMQGYDSVAVKADVELGGTDQRFNLLAGRTLQPLYHQPAQDILTMNLLEGTDGRKMSSSWGNVINIVDSPDDMFGKIMSIPDGLIVKYFEYATQVSADEIAHVAQDLEKGANPRDLKMRLATEIVMLYHRREEAQRAAAEFERIFSKKEKPSEIKEFSGSGTKLLDFMVEHGLAVSKSEAKQLFDQGAIKINDRALSKLKDTWNYELQAGDIIQVGPRKFAKVK